jgi:NTE family protein
MPLLRDKLRAEPWSLALSSGFFGFYAHAGLLSVLEDHGLVPRLVAGSSAGALAGGLWAAGVSAQTMSRTLSELERRDFWDPGVGFGLLRGRLFRERLESLLPLSAIEDTRISLAVSLFDIFGRRTVVRQSGSIAAAIHGSCALPGLFQPVWIDRRPYSDGGILDRPGWLGLDTETFTLAHHLPSRGKHPLTRRAETTVLAVRNLPLVTPFSLRRGNEAFATARMAAQKALVTAVADVIEV